MREKPVPASTCLLKSLHRALAACLALSMVFSQTAWALPTGYVAESGEVTFDTSDPNTLVIQASDRSIIRFDTFSIGSGETVQFIQPGETSSVLGRVTGTEASDLFGSLRANGEFLLINSAGIHFHPGADVQAGSFIASTLDVQNALYLAGRYEFEKAAGAGPGEILNEGRLAADDGGHLILLADRVRNAGTLEAHLGTVAIAAAEKATLSFDDQGLVSVVIDRGLAERLAGGAPVENSGAISADGGKVVLTAKTLNETLDTLINNTGIIQAAGVVEKNGTIEFVANGGAESSGTVRTADLRIGAGTALHAKDTSFFIEGNWTNEGVFDGGNSLVEFAGALRSEVRGDNVFHDFRVTTPDKMIAFESDRIQTITGTWTVRGAYAHHVRLVSDDPGSRWLVDPQGTRDISYAWVEDSHNLDSDKILMTESTNRGNSVNWDPTGTWIGPAGGQWSDGVNWAGTGGAAPGAGDDVVFNMATITDSTVDAAFGGAIGSLTLDTGYSNTVSMVGADLTIVGALTIRAGTFVTNINRLTVGGLTTVSNTGILSISDLPGATLNGGATVRDTGTLRVLGGSTLDVNGDLLITEAAWLNLNPAGTITVSGDWAIGGVALFTAGGLSEVVFDGCGQMIMGNATFADFTKTSADNDILTFEAGSTQTIDGVLTLNGSGPGAILCLRSSTTGSSFIFDLSMADSASANFVHVQDSTLIGGAVAVTNSTEPVVAPNNAGWVGLTPSAFVCQSCEEGGGSPPGNPPPGDPPPDDPILPPSEPPIDPRDPDPDDGPNGLTPPNRPGPDRAAEGPRSRPEQTGEIETYVFVDEGTVDVNQRLVYDGEGILVKPDGSIDVRMRAIYVTTVDGIRVFRGKIHTPLKDIKMSEAPQSVAATRDGKRVYAIAAKSGLRAIETSSFASRDVFGADEGSISVSVSADSSKVYVTNGVRDTLKVIDVKSEKVLKTFATGSMPSQVAATRDGSKLYVLNRLDRTVTRLDAETGLQDLSFEAGQAPYGLALSADEKEMFVTDTLGDAVRVFDLASGRETGVIPVGDSPTAIQRDPKGERFFVSNHGSHEMSVIDAASKKEIGRIAVGRLPSGLAVTPEGDKVYVANQLSGDLSIVHVLDGRVETIPVGVAPGQVVISTPEPLRRIA